MLRHLIHKNNHDTVHRLLPCMQSRTGAKVLEADPPFLLEAGAGRSSPRNGKSLSEKNERSFMPVDKKVMLAWEQPRQACKRDLGFA